MSSSTDKSRPVVSVVIDGYNESRSFGTARDTLLALERQTFPLKQVEVVLIGSASQVKEWQTVYSDKTPFGDVRFAVMEHAHYLEMKLRGAELVSGSIVAFSDSDVFPTPAWLASVVEGIQAGADVTIGMSLFKVSNSWRSDSASRLAAASITWGWIIGKKLDPLSHLPVPVGFMDHNVAFRTEIFRRYPPRLDNGRLLNGPLSYRALKNAGVKMILIPKQQVVHYFAWPFWLSKLHFRYGYEVYLLRRLDKTYPNQWIARTGILEPLVTMAWHTLLDVPRWWRVSRLLEVPLRRRIAILPLLLILSLTARGAEMLGMYSTMLARDVMKRWAEAV
jgi:hypothetical protein